MNKESRMYEFGMGRELLGKAILAMYPGLFDLDQKSAIQRMAEEGPDAETDRDDIGSERIERNRSAPGFRAIDRPSGKTPTSR